MPGSHFLYSWSLDDNHQTVAQFFTDLSSGKTETVLLGTNFRRVSDGDWLWFSFTKSDGDIVAVAQTLGEPFQGTGTRGRWQIQVRWMEGLTTRLRKTPLALNVPEQSRQGSPQRAVPSLERVLKKWLNGNYSTQARKADETVRWVRRSMLQRQGQQEFRRRLLTAYRGQCAVTGCTEEGTLQAAHIRPVSSKGDHHVSNGLLLRADIHNLFDLGLIAIDQNLVIHVSKQVSEPAYRAFDMKKVHVPQGPGTPSRSALLWHFNNMYKQTSTTRIHGKHT